jgi:peroxiredoxin
MKKVNLLLLVLFFIQFGYCSSSSFLVNGSVKGLNTGVVELSYMTFKNNKWTENKSSTPLNKGKFVFQGQIDEPVVAILMLNSKELRMYIEPTVMKLSLDINKIENYKLVGSKTQTDYDTFHFMSKANDELFEKYVAEMQSLNKQLSSLSKDSPEYMPTSEKLKVASQQVDSNYHLKTKMIADYITSHPTSYFPILSNALMVYVSRDYMSLDSARILFDKTDNKLKKYRRSIEFDQYLKVRENTKQGKPAPDFTTTDYKGNSLSLSGFRNKKYVLIDFWASWCVPCVKGLPYIRNFFDKYKNELEVVFISVDTSKKDWLSAISKYDMSYGYNVLSVRDVEKFLQGYRDDNDVRNKYPNDGVPKYILINKAGKIVNSWVGYSEENEKDMDKVLKQTLGK